MPLPLPRLLLTNSAPLGGAGGGGGEGRTPPTSGTPPPKRNWANFASGPSAYQKFSLVPLAPVLASKLSSAPLASLRTQHPLQPPGRTSEFVFMARISQAVFGILARVLEPRQYSPNVHVCVTVLVSVPCHKQGFKRLPPSIAGGDADVGCVPWPTDGSLDSQAPPPPHTHKRRVVRCAQGHRAGGDCGSVAPADVTRWARQSAWQCLHGGDLRVSVPLAREGASANSR